MFTPFLLFVSLLPFPGSRDAARSFNAYIFASDIDILACDNTAAFNVRSLICIQVHITFNTANCASHLLNVLIGVLVLLLFLANGKA